MATTPPNPSTGGLSLPPWAVTLVGGILVSAATSWGTFQYAQGQAAGERRELERRITLTEEYIRGEKARREKELEDFQQKRQDYADRMEQLLEQYKNATPAPKTP